MPTTRPRHQVTETPEVARALDLAARRWPDEPRSRLLVRLVTAGGLTLAEGHDEETGRRLAAIGDTAGKYADAFADGYLSDLRDDWPA
ncbi:hypothetical protein SGUI_2370 [Serinicoccus hydrothermalis]|uniref:Uncharacterized protein n=1 Tax=Serinicoccus hydrothermalis TaxID=1758689 RepID=A0A1B1NEA8_9MICO|nr:MULTISPECIES: hypothetical protein [Serinicoccus]ANS79766.1 hypothetical protein SGUI_2370 [Serinicoccus hydrothermalis]OLT41856.1 hypothetical protein BJF86_02275 [Serinicoccus sp. CNJ-927]